MSYAVKKELAKIVKNTEQLQNKDKPLIIPKWINVTITTINSIKEIQKNGKILVLEAVLCLNHINGTTYQLFLTMNNLDIMDFFVSATATSGSSSCPIYGKLCIPYWENIVCTGTNIQNHFTLRFREYDLIEPLNI